MDDKIFREVPKVVHNAVLDALDSLDEGSTKNRRAFSSAGRAKRKRGQSAFRLPQAAIVGIAVFLVSGITVSAMGLLNLYRQRMEEMDEDTLDQDYSVALAGETTGFNRSYTAEEWSRYEELNEKYENGGLFPEGQIVFLENAAVYDGDGVALDTSCSVLYLPDRALSDEELLEIIDYQHKETYSIYKQNEERIVSGGGWESRMTGLSDERVDQIYRSLYSGDGDISGIYSRPLTEAENSRYEELNRQYEEDGLYVKEDLTIIQSPEEYTGEGVSICAQDSTYYFPERELTDEELLQLIDFQHKGPYCIDRINQEIQMGLRREYP